MFFARTHYPRNTKILENEYKLNENLAKFQQSRHYLDPYFPGHFMVVAKITISNRRNTSENKTADGLETRPKMNNYNIKLKGRDYGIFVQNETSC